MYKNIYTLESSEDNSLNSFNIFITLYIRRFFYQIDW